MTPETRGAELPIGPAAEPGGERALARAIGAGHRPEDAEFDQFLPAHVRKASPFFWTPLEVVFRAAGWLDELGVHRVVDVGSGAGKFCVSAALASRCAFVGFEQRPGLVEAAEGLARRFGVGDRVTFVEGTLGRTEVPVGDAYYFFNPFGENLFGAVDHFDESVELSIERYKTDVRAAVALLRGAAVGTLALTYNGFGGRMPDGYVLVKVDRTLPNVLRLWKKFHASAEEPSPGHSGGAVREDREFPPTDG